MNSFLLIEKQTEKHRDRAWQFCLEKGIDPLDITIIDTKQKEDTDLEYKTSSKLKGIALIREVYKSIALKPLRSDKKALIIVESDKLSIPAQNALLKTIEEPPQSTLIILTSENKNLLLPTILSRCLIIQEEKQKDDNPLTEQDDSVFSELLSLSTALKNAETLSKDKQKAMRTIQVHMKDIQEKLQQAVLKNDEEEIATFQNIQRKYLHTYTQIQSTNINVRLALENLFLTGYVSKNKITS